MIKEAQSKFDQSVKIESDTREIRNLLNETFHAVKKRDR